MKRVFALLTVWCLALATVCLAQQDSLPVLTPSAHRPKVGLVLSGGGARGAAHVGVIRLIEEMQIPVDYVVGTSMGAIIGGLYAVGYTAAEMDSLMMSQDWKMLLSNDAPRRQQPYVQRMARKRYQINIPYEKGMLAENSAHYRDAGIKVRRSSLQTFPKVLARPGLIDGLNLMDKFVQLTSAYGDSVSYDTLPRSFACVATDLVTGRGVVMNRGNLAQSIRASMSIPGVFYPVYKGEQVLVDGGVVNNYPVNVARDMGAEVVIGVEVNSAHITAGELQSFASVFERLIGTLGSNLHELNVNDTDILIQPPVRQFPVMGFDTVNLRKLIDIGYRTALLSMPQLDSLKQVVRESGDMVHSTEAMRPCSNSSLETSAESRAGVSARPSNQVSLGLRLDSEDAAAALLRISINRLWLSGLKCDLTTRVSIHPSMTARLAYAKETMMPQVNLSLRYGYTDVSAPHGTGFSYHTCGSDLYLSHLLSSDFDLRMGICHDNFWVRTLSSYAPRQSCTTLYALWRNDLYDAAYTPTRGYAYDLGVSYNIMNRAQWSNFWALQASVSAVVPLGNTTAVIPTLHARSLLGESIPQLHSNAIGGYLPHRYMRQQIPFAGFVGCEFVYPHLLLPSLSLRQRLMADVYATGIVNYAYSTTLLRGDASAQGIWGAGLQLSYDTTIGPLALCVHWSDLYHRLGLYFTLGFEF